MKFRLTTPLPLPIYDAGPQLLEIFQGEVADNAGAGMKYHVMTPLPLPVTY
jgi:hypothetical protein